jgi:hypothetical protein
VFFSVSIESLVHPSRLEYRLQTCCRKGVS